jgi:hypothetical protein
MPKRKNAKLRTLKIKQSKEKGTEIKHLMRIRYRMSYLILLYHSKKVKRIKKIICKIDLSWI